MSKTYGLGIIGAGVILDEHMLAYQALADRLRVVGIADLDPMKLRHATSRFFLPYAYEDYRELLARDDVDIVAICTPPCAHEELAVAALEAGKHVICEKPLAHTLASADRIIEASARFPNKLSTVFQLRFLPEIRRMIWLRDQGKLGRLIMGRVTRTECLRKTPSIKSGWWGKWDVAGGGAAMTQFIHEFDLLLHIFGPPMEVTAQLDTHLEGIESEDTFSALIRFENGAEVTCSCTSAGQRHTSTLDVFGEFASVHRPWNVDSFDPRQRARLQQESVRAVPAPRDPRSRHRFIRLALGGMRKFGLIRRVPKASSHTPYVRAVLDAIDSGSSPPTPPQAARESLELCMGVYTSALTGKTVSLPLDSSNPYYEGIKATDYQRIHNKVGTDSKAPKTTGS